MNHDAVTDEMPPPPAEIRSAITLVCGPAAFHALMSEDAQRKAKMHFTQDDIRQMHGCDIKLNKLYRNSVVVMMNTITNRIIKRWEGVQ